MLVEIKPHTNVPTDQEVVAFDQDGNSKIGLLYRYFDFTWGCIPASGNQLKKVTHFVTIENLLKTK